MIGELPNMVRGREALDAYLAENAVDVASLDPDGFERWLGGLIEEFRRDPVFARRSEIRDLRHENRRKIAYRRSRITSALLAYRECGCADDVDATGKAMTQTRRAVEGLRGAVAEGRADPEKLATYEVRLGEQERTHHELVDGCSEHDRLERARRSLVRFEAGIGLPEAEGELGDILKRRGQRSSSGGARFEEISEAFFTRVVIPDIAPGAVCLSGLTLGCARGEFDHLVVTPPQGLEPVEVIAMVEAKRNVNDLAHGFRVRQENLSWLRSDAKGFDPSAYRTQMYPTGHFDRAYDHVENGVTFRFDPSSFGGFHRGGPQGDYLDRLWFVTEARRLNGISGAEREKIASKLANDPRIRLDRPKTLAPLRRWILGLLSPLQAQGVLARYAAADLGHQILLLERNRPKR